MSRLAVLVIGATLIALFVISFCAAVRIAALSP